MNIVLLIWDEIPESSTIYLITVDNETLHRLKRCHGKYCNYPDFDQSDESWLIDFVNKIPKSKTIFSTRDSSDLDEEVKIPKEAMQVPASWLIHTGFGL